MNDNKDKDQNAGVQQGSTTAEQDRKLPENSKENLDKKLDHAIEETFRRAIRRSSPRMASNLRGYLVIFTETGSLVGNVSSMAWSSFSSRFSLEFSGSLRSCWVVVLPC